MSLDFGFDYTVELTACGGPPVGVEILNWSIQFHPRQLDDKIPGSSDKEWRSHPTTCVIDLEGPIHNPVCILRSQAKKPSIEYDKSSPLS